MGSRLKPTAEEFQQLHRIGSGKLETRLCTRSDCAKKQLQNVLKVVVNSPRAEDQQLRQEWGKQFGLGRVGFRSRILLSIQLNLGDTAMLRQWWQRCGVDHRIGRGSRWWLGMCELKASSEVLNVCKGKLQLGLNTVHRPSCLSPFDGLRRAVTGACVGWIA